MISRSFCVHPLTSISFIKRFFPLLIIPALRSLYMLIIYGEVGLSFWDLVVSAAVITIGVLRCRAYTVTMTEGNLSIKTGVVFKNSTEFSLSKISGVITESIPLMAAYRVKIETEADDIVFYAHRKNALALINHAIGCTEGLKRHRWSLGQTVLMSLTKASALSGLLISATVINYLGKLLGRRLERDVLDTLTDTAISVSRLIPPALTVIAAIIAVGFGISFIMVLIKNATFAVGENGQIISTSQGLLWRRYEYIKKDRINACRFIQPPVMRLLRRSFMQISIVGSERIISAASGVKDVAFNLKKPKRIIRRAVTLPLILAAASLFPLILARGAIGIATTLSAAGVAFFLYSMDIRLVGAKQGGVYIGETIRVRDAIKMTLKDTIVDAKRVECITFKQTPFDRKWKVCFLKVRARGTVARARDIDLAEAEKKLNRTLF